MAAIVPFCFVAGVSKAAAELNLLQMEAGFLYNFALLTDWPEEHRIGDVIVCLAADAALTKEIDAIAGKPVGESRVRVRRIASEGDAAGCRILFVSYDRPFPALDLAALHSTSTLTVSDQAGFAERGGAIELMRRGDRLRFVLNLDAAQAARLRFRAQMIKLADRVIGGGFP